MSDDDKPTRVERAVHARVPAELDAAIRELAARFGVPSATVVRRLLEIGVEALRSDSGFFPRDAKIQYLLVNADASDDTTDTDR